MPQMSFFNWMIWSLFFLTGLALISSKLYYV